VPSLSGDEPGEGLVLPKSGDMNVFGNRLNNNNIIYSSTDKCYYLSMPYYVNDIEGSTDSILQYKNKLDEDLTTFEKLSDESFEQLQSVDGRLFYLSDGKLFCREGEKESVLIESDVLDYCVDGDYVYYKINLLAEVWQIEIGSDDLPIKLPIEKVFDFQASNGMFFYNDETSV
jgi:hypothetical protein